MKQLYSHLAAHPQIIAVPHVTAFPFKLRSLGYISDSKSCRERKKGTKSRRTSSSRFRLQISDEYHARQICWGKKKSHSRSGTEISLLVGSASTGPAGDTKMLPGACCHGAAVVRRLQGAGAGSRHREAARRRGKGDLS